MKKRKNIITVAIDSPAAAGAGTQAKLISEHYNLYHLETSQNLCRKVSTRIESFECYKNSLQVQLVIRKQN